MYLAALFLAGALYAPPAPPPELTWEKYEEVLAWLRLEAFENPEIFLLGPDPLPVGGDERFLFEEVPFPENPIEELRIPGAETVPGVDNYHAPYPLPPPGENKQKSALEV